MFSPPRVVPFCEDCAVLLWGEWKVSLLTRAVPKIRTCGRCGRATSSGIVVRGRVSRGW